MINSFSEKAMMRISVWIELLYKACDYLVVCEKYYQELHHPDGCLKGGTYYIGKSKFSYYDNWVIEKGLSEAAVIAIASILSGPGDGNENISGNQSDEIKTIRKNLLKRVAKELNYSDYEQFKKYYENLIYLRNKIVAHYDATASEYKVVADGIVSTKTASATFLPDEITKLKNFAFALLETLCQILTEQESC